VPLLAMIGRLDCGDLGYDLGYLRHGSIGPGFARWPDRSRRGRAGCDGRACPLYLVALRWRASVRASYGLDAGAMVARSTTGPDHVRLSDIKPQFTCETHNCLKSMRPPRGTIGDAGG
jgi:hypothetical protein